MRPSTSTPNIERLIAQTNCGTAAIRKGNTIKSKMCCACCNNGLYPLSQFFFLYFRKKKVSLLPKTRTHSVRFFYIITVWNGRTLIVYKNGVSCTEKGIETKYTEDEEWNWCGTSNGKCVGKSTLYLDGWDECNSRRRSSSSVCIWWL